MSSAPSLPITGSLDSLVAGTMPALAAAATSSTPSLVIFGGMDGFVPFMMRFVSTDCLDQIRKAILLAHGVPTSEMGCYAAFIGREAASSGTVYATSTSVISGSRKGDGLRRARDANWCWWRGCCGQAGCGPCPR